MPTEIARTDAELSHLNAAAGARWRLAAKLALGLFAIGIAFWLGRDLSHHLNELEAWVESQGAWAYVVFVAALILGTSIFIPDTLFALIAGAVFGLFVGAAVMTLGCIATAAIDYLIGCRLLHETVQRLIARSPRLAAIERAVHGEGLRFQFLLRLTPFHQVTISYLLGAAKVRFSTFLVACVGIAPWIFVEVYLGYMAKHAAMISSPTHRPSALETATTVLGLLLCGALLLYVVRIAKRALAQYEQPQLSPQVRQSKP